MGTLLTALAFTYLAAAGIIGFLLLYLREIDEPDRNGPVWVFILFAVLWPCVGLALIYLALKEKLNVRR